MKVEKKVFGKLLNGKQAHLYTIENSMGTKLVLSDYGATIVNIFIKDGNDELIDVALGHLAFEQYIKNSGNLGCVVGRNANRIENAQIDINNIKYDLEVNDGPNNLHTGSNGLQTSLLKVDCGVNQITFIKIVKHLEDGFPGNLYIEITYTLTQDNQIVINYMAKSDQDTVVNLTNHSYFNLNGQDQSSIYNHKLKIDANFYSPNTKDSIPTGEIVKVENSDFDFKDFKYLKQPLNSQNEQIKSFNGIDHNFLLNGSGLRNVASLYNPKNNLLLEVITDKNAMHVYSANHFPDDSTINKNNLKYPLHGGIAFETQTVPNALNMPWLKSPLLLANNLYKTTTIFKFSVKK